MGSTTLYKVFDSFVDFREESDRSRYGRYHDACMTVDEAYQKLREAIQFNAYDLEDEVILNGIRKRIFYFQRKTQDKLYELRDSDIEVKEQDEIS